MLSKPIAYSITFVVCILLQACIAPNIAILGASPNFLLIPVLLLALRSGIGVASIAGFFLGLLYDGMNSATIGCMALVFVLIAWGIGAIAGNMDTSSISLALIFAGVGSLLSECLYSVVVLLISTDSSGGLTAFVQHALPAFLYTGLFACIALSTITLVMEHGGDYQPKASSSSSAKRNMFSSGNKSKFALGNKKGSTSSMRKTSNTMKSRLH